MSQEEDTLDSPHLDTAGKIEHLFYALGSTKRLHLVRTLAELGGEATHKDLTDEMGAKGTVWHHLRILEEAGIVKRRHPGHRRDCSYRLNVNALSAARRELDRWINVTVLVRQALTPQDT